MCMLSHVWLFVTLWTVARQAPLSMGLSRQDTEVSIPFPGDLPNPRIKLASAGCPELQAVFFTAELPGKPLSFYK